MRPYRFRPPAALAFLIPLLLIAASAHAENKPAWIDGFSGWAGPGGGWVYARIHNGNPIVKPKPGESTYERLKSNVEALETNALKQGKVAVHGVPGLTTAQADDNGFLKIKLPAGLKPGIHQVTMNVATEGFMGRPTTVNVMVWDDKPGIGVISDIDDTLTDSGVTHKLKLLVNTLFHTTWEIKTFPGAPQAVTAVAGKLHSFPVRPTFYLSGSPWGLHQRISDFFDRSGFPHAAMILRRYSQEPLNPYEFKHPHLQEIFAAFPHTKWVLLGDSGEKDPEVYAQMRKEKPNAIEHVYIHNVTKEQPNAPRFAGATVFNEWPEVTRDATAKGFLAPAPAPAPAAKAAGGK
jgi:phosphatidate phosphatase APP1